MEILQLLGYYLAIDAVLSLLVVAVFFVKRKTILYTLKTRLRTFLNVNQIDSRLTNLEFKAGIYDEEGDSYLHDDAPIDPDFEEGLKEEFDIN